MPRQTLMAVDDEPLALRDLMRALEARAPGAEVRGFTTASEALAFATGHKVDVAFCDIELPETNGIALAKQLKDAQPALHIVFVTSYEKYALEAYSVHATGYLLKPVDAQELERELTFIYGRSPAEGSRVEVVTFGGFEVYVDGRPVAFRRAKAKELLALLVDHQGTGVTAREASSVLWEDEPYGRAQRSYYQTTVASLRASLEGVGAAHILEKGWNSLAIRPDAISCDLYRFLAGDPLAVNSYRGSYLPSYSWAEFTVARLESGR